MVKKKNNTMRRPDRGPSRNHSRGKTICLNWKHGEKGFKGEREFLQSNIKFKEEGKEKFAGGIRLPSASIEGKKERKRKEGKEESNTRRNGRKERLTRFGGGGSLA